jgi:hypothetical protein
MADNWLSSFAVALGFDVDTASLNTAKKSIADYERAVKDAEKRIEDARWAGAKTEEEIAKLTRETNLKEARAALAAAQDKEKAEKEQAKKREERHKEFITGMNRVALAAGAMATALSYAVNRVTQAFDGLGFVSARTGASVQSIKSLGYAFKQVGGSSEQAMSAVEKFAQALRQNDGLKAYVQSLGVDTTKDTADQLLDTVNALSKHEYQVGSREAGMLGISEEDYKLLTQYAAKVKEYRAEYDATTKALGVNSGQAAEASQSFQRTLTRLQATVSALSDKLMVSLAPALEAIVKRFNDFVAANPEKIDAVLKTTGDAIVWVADKIRAMVEWFASDNGERFMERWNNFGDRVKAIGTAFETVWAILKKIDEWLHLSSIYSFIDKLGTLALSGRFGLGGAVQDALGVGSGAGGAGVGVNATPGATAGPKQDTRSWWERHAPTALGGKPDPNAPNDGRGRLNARDPEGPGKYRPEYKLGDADLDQQVVNVIAGEAQARNPESIDAVINNMLNRVGSKGWGPSANLLQVATAPGQYAGKRAAGEAESTMIRERIRAIASGGLPDNTGGANAYRASWYTGPWAQKHAQDGRVVGGNRYAYEPGVPNGPYAPYANPKEVVTPRADATTRAPGDTRPIVVSYAGF